VRRFSKFMSQPKLRRSLLAIGAFCALNSATVYAQNLDQGKSATRLFAESCATCHRSAHGLAKGRARAKLFQYLQEHYASNSTTAGELASYLASVDRPPNSRSQTAPGKPSRAATPRPAAHRPKPVPSARSN
jgi:mono/diheme cytochrome c family protein